MSTIPNLNEWAVPPEYPCAVWWVIMACDCVKLPAARVKEKEKEREREREKGEERGRGGEGEEKERERQRE